MPTVDVMTDRRDHRERATSFGGVAELYDRARPTYPPALIDLLLADEARDVLDVGAGTGIASRLFAARGCTVLAVEPDYRMAAIAAGHGFAVEVDPFLEWRPRGRRFDLVAAAESWHWVEPFAGARHAVAVLRPGGRFAAFWNVAQPDDDVRDALAACLDRYPDPDHSFVRSIAERVSRTVEGLMDCGQFDDLATTAVVHEVLYTGDEFADMLATHSAQRMLSAADRDAQLTEVRGVVDQLGGLLTMSYETVCVTARVVAEPV